MRAGILFAFALACGTDPLTQLPDAGGMPVEDAEASLDAKPVEMGDAAEVAEDAAAPDAVVDAGMIEPMDAGSNDAEPAPTEPPPLRPYSGGGACPTLVSGSTNQTSINTGFVSAGDTRSFRLVVPTSYDPAQDWPVVFGWHWLNASSGSFVDDAEIESAIEEMGFIAVLPDRLEDANGDKAYLFDWPFVEVSDAEKELVFFDDLLTCVSEQFSVDLNRVYGIGVSAGALWLTYLMSTDRVDYLAAVESLSGGLGAVAGAWEMTFTPRPHKFPAIVLWGGPNDWLGLSFSAASERLRDALLADGHFVVVCTHDAGHAIPPITAPPNSSTRFWSLWRFMLDHPYGLAPSPYVAAGLPEGFPAFCSVP